METSTVLVLSFAALGVFGYSISALPIESNENLKILKILENIEETIGNPCPKGWKRFKNYCYLVSSSIWSWPQARAYCRALGGDLVKINSAEENEFVLNLVQKQVPTLKTVWIGLQWNTNAFYWYDRSAPVYKNWAPREPNGNAKTPCVHLYIKNTGALPYDANGYWNDAYCHPANSEGTVCKQLA